MQAVKADVEHYAVEKDYFDYIAACSCLEHVSNKQAFMEALERLQRELEQEAFIVLR
ncbi:methyltransferase domain-containing protein [Paenibacillus amylolyticus]|nr:methyltransferase domain-containing protein [Paenibacillus amylolyticus]